jgi:tetratricopeptide (TPR) repeat protein
MVKIKILAYVFLLLLCFQSCHRNIQQNSKQKQNSIEEALASNLQPTSVQNEKEATKIYQQVIEAVSKADYENALNISACEVKKHPNSFMAQMCLAAILGDYSELFAEPLKSSMIQKSKQMFEKLMGEVSFQPKKLAYKFKNEYYFRLGKHKEQYENGLEMLNDFYNTTEYNDDICAAAYYNQGVGAAHYAKLLLLAGKRKEALEYAQKAIIAWAQYFSLVNTYYNSYVHYGLALGILGKKDEMMRALERSANLINRDLNYTEFKDVIDFINNSKI